MASAKSILAEFILMGTGSGDPQIGNLKALVEPILRARNKPSREPCNNVLFLGAGASASAGVPLVTEIAKRLTVALAKSYLKGFSDDANSALTALIADNHFAPELYLGGRADWPAICDYIFSTHYVAPKETRDVFTSLMPTPAQINWAHLCVGELVAQKFSQL